MLLSKTMLSSNVHRLLPMQYKFMPLPWRRIIYPLLLVRRVYRSLRMDIWLAEGYEKSSLQPLCLAYSASAINENYLLDRVFAEGVRTKWIGRWWLWRIERELRNMPDRVSLALIQVPDQYVGWLRMRDAYEIPCWVAGDVDLATLEQTLQNSSIKSDLRRIRKHRIRCSVTRDSQGLEDFYNNMYVPQVLASHGKSAYVEPYGHVAELFEKGELLLVSNDEEAIGGIIIVYDKQFPRLWVMGVREAREEYRRQGVVGAIFYFALEHLRESGCQKAGMGGSRAFLDDGVLQYKKKWQQRISATFGGTIVVKCIQPSEAAQAFFTSNPFIYKDNGLNAGVFIDSSAIDKEDMIRLREQYLLPGLSRLIVHGINSAKEFGAFKRVDQIPS